MDSGGIENTNGIPETSYRVYTRRWFVLLTVVLLNVSNGALWITYAPVSTTAADFYGTTPDIINYFSQSYLILSLPLSFLCTYLINSRGLFFVIHAGALLNTAGAIIKAIGTASFVGGPGTQLAISFVGQILCAFAQSFLFYISTKTSQDWFAEHERMSVTTVAAMADPLGAVVGQIATPYIVKSTADIPLNNYIWVGLAVFSQVVCWVSVNRSTPLTPPSPSSHMTDTTGRGSWWSEVVAVFTDRNYWLLLISIGYSIGLFTSISTVSQQMLCSLGYSTSFCGWASSFPQLFGFLGSGLIGAYVTKTRKYITTCKVVYGIGALTTLLLGEFYLQPNQHTAILVSAALFGMFAVGGFPVGLELGVETTYPVCETISSAFILMLGQIEGVILIQVIQALAGPLKAEYEDVQVCSSDPNSLVKAMDYTYAVIFLMCISTVINLSLILFFDTDYKRTNADKAAPINKSLPDYRDYDAIQSQQSGVPAIVQRLESPGDSYRNEDSSHRNGRQFDMLDS